MMLNDVYGGLGQWGYVISLNTFFYIASAQICNHTPYTLVLVVVHSRTILILGPVSLLMDPGTTLPAAKTIIFYRFRIMTNDKK